jgi:hypothetical protein
MLYGSNSENFEDIKIQKYRLALSKQNFTKMIVRPADLPTFLSLISILKAFRRKNDEKK